MTDTHCHLSFPQFDIDRDEVLGRAQTSGVETIVNPGTDLAQSRAAVELAGRTNGVYAAVGVHPHDVGTLTEEAFSALRDLALSPKVVAIGEIGLEKSSRSTSLEIQRAWLDKLIKLARETSKPCIFHVRDAHAEFRAFLEQHGEGIRGVAHCFSGSIEDANFYLARGLYLGVTGVVTFPNAKALREVIRNVPLDHILLETDAPFLAPQSYCGKRNEPSYLKEIAEAVEAIHEIDVRSVQERTEESARQLFGVS